MQIAMYQQRAQAIGGADSELARLTDRGVDGDHDVAQRSAVASCYRARVVRRARDAARIFELREREHVSRLVLAAPIAVERAYPAITDEHQRQLASRQTRGELQALGVGGKLMRKAAAASARASHLDRHGCQPWGLPSPAGGLAGPSLLNDSYALMIDCTRR